MNTPEKIYLTVHDHDWEGYVMWCEDRINDDDIEYTRADIAQAKTEFEIEKHKAAVDTLIKAIAAVHEPDWHMDWETWAYRSEKEEVKG